MGQLCCGDGFNKTPPNPKLILDQEEIISTQNVVDFGPYYAESQVTHTQWIYQCVLIHDCTTGTLILAHKEDLLREIEHQLTLGPDSLAEEDRILLESNFDDLTMSTGEQQEYWLVAIRAAREASCIHAEAGATQQSSLSTGQRWALF